MKQYWVRISSFVLGLALLAPVVMVAQNDGEKGDKGDKGKKDVEQYIITRKGESGKVVVEIDGDKVTINGKPMEEFKDKDGNISVKKSRFKGDLESLLSFSRTPYAGGWNINGNEAFNFFALDSNRAMLGVNTEKTEEGVRVIEITKESAAEKSGLKKGDIIIGLDDTKIEDADDLSKAVRSHKPGDKVTIRYKRDNKENKTTAELSRWEGLHSLSAFGPNKFEYNLMPKLENLRTMPKIESPQFRMPYSQNWNWEGGSSKLGLSVQDTDDGKGVKVIGIDDDSNAAKAGLKENDVITEVDGKAVNSTDEIVKIIRESKSKASIMVKLSRGGKVQHIEVKMPRKIKSADL